MMVDMMIDIKKEWGYAFLGGGVCIAFFWGVRGAEAPGYIYIYMCHMITLYITEGATIAILRKNMEHSFVKIYWNSEENMEHLGLKR